MCMSWKELTGNSEDVFNIVRALGGGMVSRGEVNRHACDTDDFGTKREVGTWVIIKIQIRFRLGVWRF